MTAEQLTRHFLVTGEHDVLHGAWPGGDLLAKACTAENTLRAALIEEVGRRMEDRDPPSLPPGFDSFQFVHGKVGPMVRGFFPARERQILLDLFDGSLVFVSHDNIEQILSETQWLHSAWQIANLYLGSLDLPGLNKQPVHFVGLSENTTFFVSMAYFEDANPFADWVVHEAAHVLHNWKRDRVGLTSTRTREFLLPIAYAKRELFAYACEAYAMIVENAKGPAGRRRLHAEYARSWMTDDDRLDRGELVAVVAEAVDARNGWKRILQRCIRSE